MQGSLWQKTAASVCRWLFLGALAGHLLFRREFAHRNLAELFEFAGVQAPHAFSRVYLTEAVLLMLFPTAILIVWQRLTLREPTRPGEADLSHGMGASFYLALAFLLWGFGHAVAAFFLPHDSAYLILRQSAMAAYAIVFLYAFVLFGDRAVYIRQAVLCGIAVSIACAALDAAGLMTPAPDPASLYPDEAIYGQETLPIAILGLGLFIVHIDNIPFQLLALALLGLVLWRQGARELQSVVPVSLAGALAIYLCVGLASALGGQVRTLKRGILLTALFAGILFLGSRMSKKANAMQISEVNAWSLSTYRGLFDVYERADVPLDPKNRAESTRQPGKLISDPEVYKLDEVYGQLRAISISVVNNMWRMLMWRRMSREWRAGHPWLGAGVGTGWRYNKVLFDTPFHYEPDPGGLNPHNSYLNLLYRYGAVGIAILVILLVSVLLTACRALRCNPGAGDVLLEGLILYFTYTLVFAFFTVSLEGPSYSFPYWSALGLMYARARQLVHTEAEGLA